MIEKENITGRDDVIIAHALYVAAKVLRAQRFPETRTACDMEAILKARFPNNMEQRRILDRLQEGIRMGFELPVGGMTLRAESVEAWFEDGMLDHLELVAIADSAEAAREFG